MFAAHQWGLQRERHLEFEEQERRWRHGLDEQRQAREAHQGREPEVQAFENWAFGWIFMLILAVVVMGWVVFACSSCSSASSSSRKVTLERLLKSTHVQDALRKYAVEKDPDCTKDTDCTQGVYCLVDHGEVTYAGRTNNLTRRSAEHKKQGKVGELVPLICITCEGECLPACQCVEAAVIQECKKLGGCKDNKKAGWCHL
mmetsp:Transcript_71027/g.139499  ORF Transcript_71027/g.139499 Transcript_71027/m.139499 type:complete len:201 (-) Transcript_71027:180-782(-)